MPLKNQHGRYPVLVKPLLLRNGKMVLNGNHFLSANQRKMVRTSPFYETQNVQSSKKRSHRNNESENPSADGVKTTLTLHFSSRKS